MRQKAREGSDIDQFSANPTNGQKLIQRIHMKIDLC